ncbi:hypothetical protein [Sulfurisphaera ohwakuensis]|uniref:hypothetical protein n=1 Tax=Sulfurisphaera ohwakuensis TaxID=69656 RepID=UPI0036F364B9
MIKAVEIEQVEKIYSFYVRKLRIKTNFGTIETPRLSFTTTDINYLIDVPTTIDIRDDIVVLTNLRWLSPEAILNKDSYIDRAKKNLYEIKQKVSGQTKIIIPYIYATKKYIASLNYEEKKKFIVKAIEYQQELNFSDIVIPDMKLPLDSHGKFLGELAAQYDNVNLIPIVSDDNLQVLKYVIEKERFNTVIINFGKKENMDYYRALSNDILKYKDKNIFILGVGSTNTVKIPASQGIADLAPLQLFTPFLGIDSTLTIPSIPYKEQRPKNVNEKYQKIKQTINRLRVLDPITLKYTTFVELKEKLVEYMQTIRKYVRVDDDEVLKYDILPNLPSLYEIPSPDDIERLELYEKKLERVRKLFKVLNTCMLETEYNTLSNYISQGRVKEYLRKRKIIDKVIGADITRFSEE